MPASSYMWYDEAALDFDSSLPIGNGRLGAMIPGRVINETWVLNEDSVWYGGPMQRNPKHAADHLPLLRKLITGKQLGEAERLITRAFYGTPESMRHYQVAGHASIDFHHVSDNVQHYKRWLDIASATAGVEYSIDGVRFNREIFATSVDGIICSRFSSSVPGRLSFDLRLGRGEGLNVFYDSIESDGKGLILKAQQAGFGISFCISANIKVEDAIGSVRRVGETIVVEGAQAALVYIAIETTFRHSCPETKCHEGIDMAMRAGFEQLRAAHIADYQNLSALCTLQLGTPEECETFQSKTTDFWISDSRNGAAHPCLVSLLFQFGRYLLISSSRPGLKALPANLQGIWNNSMSPQWGSKFTININAQMNYWPAETCNLSICHEPLFDLIARLASNGEETARVMYNCRGWTAHHNTDMWGDSAPQDRWLPATLWPISGAWLCLHIWEHFQFTQDKLFLSKHLPVMRGSVQFYLDFLVEHKDGFMVTNPSLSPENTYRLDNGEEGCVCYGAVIDTQILYTLFDAYREATSIVGEAIDIPLAAEAASMQAKLPPMKIGRHGQLQEWYEDYEEVEPGHRHISHLWDVFPGTGILTREPEFRNACQVTLARRGTYGGGHTGWSRAWMIALAARFGDGDSALVHISKLLSSSTLPSLLNDHPPFQIDGNFGSTAAIAEMLVQSHAEKTVVLLPALPSKWTQGKVAGLCARGGFELCIHWENGCLVTAQLVSKHGNTCRLKYRKELSVRWDGEEIVSNAGILCFGTRAGGTYTIVPH